MKNICLISDTHGKLESWVFKHFEDSDEIWHCGDLGSISVIDSINKILNLEQFTAILIMLKLENL